MRGRTNGAGCVLNFGEAVEVSLQGGAVEGEERKFAGTGDFDQAGGFEFFEMVREGGGADAVGFVEFSAGRAGGALADLLEKLDAAGCGERAGDAGELPIAEAGEFGRWHGVTIPLSGRECPPGSL